MARAERRPRDDDAEPDTEDAALAEEELPADPRRRSRWIAVQALYEWDTAGHDPMEAAEHRLGDEQRPEAVAPLARALVAGVREHDAAIREVLERAAPGWPVTEMAVVDRNILRVAIFEVLFDNKAPVRAAVNEAVELAKTFGAESSPRFVNGVLGAVAAMTTR